MLFGWSPGIGDPTIYGWVTVVAYFAAAALCIRAGAVDMAVRGRLTVWHCLGFSLIALGINKQLDLQVLVTDVGRTLAAEEGWYDHRRIVQAIFVALVAVAGSITALLLLLAVRREGGLVQVALPGSVLLLAFIVIRAASFHSVDRLLGLRVGQLKLNHVLELGGIALIALPALLAGSSHQPMLERRRTAERLRRSRTPRKL